MISFIRRQDITITQSCNCVAFAPSFRLRAAAEWEQERLTWSSNDAAGAYNSPLKLPMVGFRSVSNGSLYDFGAYGYYWSSTVYFTIARYLDFDSSNAFMNTNGRAYGLSVRCIKN